MFHLPHCGHRLGGAPVADIPFPDQPYIRSNENGAHRVGDLVVFFFVDQREGLGQFLQVFRSRNRERPMLELLFVSTEIREAEVAKYRRSVECRADAHADQLCAGIFLTSGLPTILSLIRAPLAISATV